ncbi:MAG: HIT family protein [Flavobacteriaceae bacterium]|nr:HIT family protein [Flavobacteriaceae bacterium]
MTIFSKIITGETPCHKVAEDERFLAFLDISPLKKGHTLVIPKVEEPYIFNLDDEWYTSLHLFAKKVAKAVEKAVPCIRIGVAVIGLEVPHTHIHLVPIEAVSDMNFGKPKMQPSQEELAETASIIRACF